MFLDQELISYQYLVRCCSCSVRHAQYDRPSERQLHCTTFAWLLGLCEVVSVKMLNVISIELSKMTVQMREESESEIRK